MSGAPNGFDIDEMQMRMLSEEDEFYKDPDHMTTSESEGEEESSVMLDDGMNDLDAVKVKFAKFDEEKEVRDRTQLERRQLREATRDAVRLAELRGLTLTLALTLTLTLALTLTLTLARCASPSSGA